MTNMILLSHRTPFCGEKSRCATKLQKVKILQFNSILHDTCNI